MADTELKSFADGLMAMSIKGGYAPRVHLTKKRARALQYLLKECVYAVPDCHCGKPDECHCNDDYHAAIGWVHYQINKRWSSFELAK